jgi:FkbM family methyltransferase
MALTQLMKSGLHHFGYDLIRYPLPDWYLLRAGLIELFTALQINCIIDVGANYGQYGDFLRQIGYEGRIVSFEPVSTSFQQLQKRIKDDPRWHAYNLALGAAEDVLTMNIMGRDQFSSLLPLNSYGKTEFAEEAVVTHTEKVDIVRLDSMKDEITAGLTDPRIYLKMDTQGFDLQVLEGATGMLPLILALQSEIAVRPIYTGMPDYLTSLSKLNELDFSITSLIPVSRDRNLRIIEFDCLMVRNSTAVSQDSVTLSAG